MPIYEYQCSNCGKVFEVLQKSFDVDEAPCDTCGAPGKRLISNTSFVLKGTGWYVTDYKSNGGCSAAGGAGKHESDKNAKAEDSGKAKPAADAGTSPCAASGSTACASCASKTA